MIFDLFKKKKTEYICIPMHNCPKYSSFAEYVTKEKELNPYYFHYSLDETIIYNVKYRNILREKGADELISMLLKEAPVLATDGKSVDYLRSHLPEKLADYDIQCYHIEDSFKVFGKELHGLKEVQQRSEIFAGEHYSDLDVWTPEDYKHGKDDIHIGHMYQSYPQFDSYDACEDRSYQNYIFRTHLITKNDMRRLSELSSRSNAQRVHEDIPISMLPMLYYPGDGEYMLLATSNNK